MAIFGDTILGQTNFWESKCLAPKPLARNHSFAQGLDIGNRE